MENSKRLECEKAGGPFEAKLGMIAEAKPSLRKVKLSAQVGANGARASDECFGTLGRRRVRFKTLAYCWHRNCSLLGVIKVPTIRTHGFAVQQKI